MAFFLQIAALVLLYAIWGLCAGLMLRRLRLLVMGIGVIGAIGAYAYAMGGYGLSLAGMIVAGGCGALCGVAMTALGSRLGDHEFALATFCLVLAWDAFVASATTMTGGAYGISGLAALPGTELLGRSNAALAFAVILFLTSIGATVFERGRILRVAAAIVGRSRELGATFSINPVSVLALYGGVVGAFCALAGAVLAANVGFVGPNLISLSTSVAVVGLGMSWHRGFSAFAALLVTLLVIPELLRLLLFSGADAASLRQVLAGLALIALALVRGRTRSSAS